MKYTVKFTAKFKKDYKLALKRGYQSEKIETVIALLAEGNHQEVLISKYKDHALSGNWSGYRECHIEPDWLLIYEILDDVLVLSISRTGTHSDLFGK
ncbi:MAG: type II toxin-antitoxin system YafQ family toxin [Oscillospiraceae bacterium]|nr:type II toxin-antitoxin system YafQ family toxin [Oscillospiraceae bacterium]MDY2510323.1 type II toxin-antitoxin system YafQ family toxin [Ruminococcus callidus]